MSLYNDSLQLLPFDLSDKLASPQSRDVTYVGTWLLSGRDFSIEPHARRVDASESRVASRKSPSRAASSCASAGLASAIRQAQHPSVHPTSLFQTQHPIYDRLEIPSSRTGRPAGPASPGAPDHEAKPIGPAPFPPSLPSLSFPPTRAARDPFQVARQTIRASRAGGGGGQGARLAS